MTENESVRVLIPLENGGFTYVSVEDAPWVSMSKWSGYPNGMTTYALRHGDGKKLHREILGVTEPKIEVDHKNGNGLDNTRINLREATRAQNGANKRKSANQTTSTFKGVSWVTKVGKWAASIEQTGSIYYLGHYDDEVTAAQAYNAIAPVLFGEFASLNAVPSNPIFSAEWVTNIVEHRRGFSTNPFKGVRQRGKRWRASGQRNGKKVSLGTFDTPEQASEAYQRFMS